MPHPHTPTNPNPLYPTWRLWQFVQAEWEASRQAHTAGYWQLKDFHQRLQWMIANLEGLWQWAQHDSEVEEG